jgi:hypothetical protein
MQVNQLGLHYIDLRHPKAAPTGIPLQPVVVHTRISAVPPSKKIFTTPQLAKLG